MTADVTLRTVGTLCVAAIATAAIAGCIHGTATVSRSESIASHQALVFAANDIAEKVSPALVKKNRGQVALAKAAQDLLPNELCG